MVITASVSTPRGTGISIKKGGWKLIFGDLSVPDNFIIYCDRLSFRHRGNSDVYVPGQAVESYKNIYITINTGM